MAVLIFCYFYFKYVINNHKPHRMKKQLNFIVSIVLVYGLASCAGSRKIDFASAYKFSTYPYQKSMIKNEDSDKSMPDKSEMDASVDLKNPPVISKDISDFEKRMYRKIDVSPEEGSRMEVEKIQSKVQQLSRKEKREIRREIKTELKQMNSEAENAYSKMNIEQANQVSEITRWSIIIGSAGLVLLILGAIFSAGLLTFFGAIFVVGAAVLFILDQA